MNEYEAVFGPTEKTIAREAKDRRDRLAMAALTGLLNQGCYVDEVAIHAVKIADALIVELDKGER